MTPRLEAQAQLLRRTGTALYGPQWQRLLAERLEINERSLRRWAAGEWTLPAPVWETLRALLSVRAAELQQLRFDLKNFL